MPHDPIDSFAATTAVQAPGAACSSVSRRRLLSGLSMSAALALLPSAALAKGGPVQVAIGPCMGPVNVFIPYDYQPVVGDPMDYSQRLARATLDFIRQAFGSQNLPLWRKPMAAIALEPRVSNIARLVVEAVVANQVTYPVDPAWIMAQIMAESFFNEFAVSHSLAVGVAQFIPDTARGYGMLVAGDKPEHFAPPYARPELASRAKDYNDARAKLREMRQSRFEDEESINKYLEALLRGKPMAEADAFLAYREEKRRLNAEMVRAREDTITYLRANFEGHDIFSSEGLAFLLGFDQRVDPGFCVPAMVRYMTRQLKDLSGNILAATSAYNAGPGRVTDDGCYAPYGRIPGNTETPTYVSRILVHHHEISIRLMA